jgi:tRNA 5-methylaminomethyl-2-thiouridine biosynthesis bifunctional protein
MPIECARLICNENGIPVSELYKDVYHSASGGHAQARHVFLEGNKLPVRWQGRQTFTILETGFGLGINFLATWLAWTNDPQRCKELHFISVEKHPFELSDMQIAYQSWPEFSFLSEELLLLWPKAEEGEYVLEVLKGAVFLRLILGDALKYLSELAAKVDAFYLDGFAPEKNPELWSDDLCKSLAQLAAKGATLATWSVAGSVRQALMRAGFSVQKTSGFAEKKEMLIGYFP